MKYKDHANTRGTVYLARSKEYASVFEAQWLEQ